MTTDGFSVLFINQDFTTFRSLVPSQDGLHLRWSWTHLLLKGYLVILWRLTLLLLMLCKCVLYCLSFCLWDGRKPAHFKHHQHSSFCIDITQKQISVHIIVLFENWGTHISNHEDCCFLGYDAAQAGEEYGCSEDPAAFIIYPDVGGSRISWNISTLLADYMAIPSRRQASSYTLFVSSVRIQ